MSVGTVDNNNCEFDELETVNTVDNINSDKYESDVTENNNNKCDSDDIDIYDAFCHSKIYTDKGSIYQGHCIECTDIQNKTGKIHQCTSKF